MSKYRFVGTEPVCFVTIQRNASPGEILELAVPPNHPLLVLVDDEVVAEEVPTESAVEPETNESPVSGDELKEN